MPDPNLLTLLISALCLVESGNDPNAVGDSGKAVGILQIHQCVIDDVNPLGYNFKPDDRFIPDKSKEICRLYLIRWGRRYERTTGKQATPEILAMVWNGGPTGYKKRATISYWLRVEAILDK